MVIHPSINIIADVSMLNLQPFDRIKRWKHVFIYFFLSFCISWDVTVNLTHPAFSPYEWDSRRPVYGINLHLILAM